MNTLPDFDPDCLESRDPQLIGALLPSLRAFNERYFRLRREGLEHIHDAPALYVSNHNGGIAGPDLACTTATLWERLGAQSPLFALTHDFAMRQFSQLGRLLQRVGAVRACPQNAVRVLESGGSALVYPGGDIEAYRHTRQRDHVVFGQRDGFVRIAQRTRVPIIPIVVQGAHRSAYIFHDGARIASAMRMRHWARLQRFPLALALPWGLAIGPWMPYLPLPFPIRLRVLPPMRFAKTDDPRVASETVRLKMQDAMNELARRSS